MNDHDHENENHEVADYAEARDIFFQLLMDKYPNCFSSDEEGEIVLNLLLELFYIINNDCQC